MLFSSKTLLPVVSVLLSILEGASAIPLTVVSNGTGDKSLARRDFGDQAAFERRVTDTVLFKRDSLNIETTLLPRFDHDILDQIDSAGPQGGRAKYTPGETKLRIGDGAKQELDRLNLHGKGRKNVIKWHKKQVTKQMKQNPELKDAKTGVIEHLSHKGGSQPNEKNHITASFKDSDNKQILNKYNGGRDHHLYVNKANKGAGRQGKAGMSKNNARLKGMSTNNKAGSGNRLGKSSRKNGGKGKGKQRQGGLTKKKDVSLRPKKSGKK